LQIVDFGCAEFGFFNYLKNIIGVEEILFVDIDGFLLEMSKKKVQPLNVDYLHPRSSPLLLRILEGSVTEPDKLLEETDAVVCIELYEFY
jgi:ribosomal protein L11 methylase PrmA